jgi:hypothetical protein
MIPPVFEYRGIITKEGRSVLGREPVVSKLFPTGRRRTPRERVVVQSLEVPTVLPHFIVESLTEAVPVAGGKVPLKPNAQIAESDASVSVAKGEYSGGFFPLQSEPLTQ